ncbi:MAG: cell division ATP-binding protein FtsE [Tissierellia bacterium]|nr:cell division ATP-binding protein FtsE [Tissierellia bacterium]
MIEFRNVSKKYSKGIDALNDVSFTIKDGDFVFIIGASGAGKTTIIKLLLKEENPTSGKVILNGKDISYLRARRIPAIRRDIGVVFQDFRLLEDRNVYNNIKFALDILGTSRKDSKKAIKKALDLVNLSDREKAFPLQLSGGEQQRVSMARAIVNNPKILIADEPTGNLDPDTSWEIMDSLLKINESGTTVIMVTHSKEIVNKLRKRVIHLERGKILRDDENGAY